MQSPKKILFVKGQKQATSAERGILVTMISGISAMGNYIPPLLIFPRVNFKSHIMIGAPSGSIGDAIPSGWSNEAKFNVYLKHFVKYSGATTQNKILLVLDNHDSHTQEISTNYAHEHDVVLLFLYPHTSHRTRLSIEQSSALSKLFIIMRSTTEC